MRGNLLPVGDESRLISLRVLRYVCVVVEVQDDHQIVGQRVFDRPIQSVEPSFFQLVAVRGPQTLKGV